MDIDVAITLGSQELLVAIPCLLVILYASLIAACRGGTSVRQEIGDIPCSVFDTVTQPVKPVGSRLKGRPISRSIVVANTCLVDSTLQVYAELFKGQVILPAITVGCFTVHPVNCYFDGIPSPFGKRNDCNGHASVGKVTITFNALDKVLDRFFRSLQTGIRIPSIHSITTHG